MQQSSNMSSSKFGQNIMIFCFFKVDNSLTPVSVYLADWIRSAALFSCFIPAGESLTFKKDGRTILDTESFTSSYCLFRSAAPTARLVVELSLKSFTHASAVSVSSKLLLVSCIFQIASTLLILASNFSSKFVIVFSCSPTLSLISSMLDLAIDNMYFHFFQRNRH